MTEPHSDLIQQNRVFGWLALATGLILSIPFIAMKFNSSVDWKAGDFIVIGALIFGLGSMFILTARKVQRTSSRIIVGVGFLLILLYLWAELAVGIFTNWGS
jgi:hypothetical protein